MTVAELETRMTEEEYGRWIALYEVEGEEQARALKQMKDGAKG